MKRGLAMLDAVRSLIDYTETNDMSEARGALLVLLEDLARSLDGSAVRPVKSGAEMVANAFISSIQADVTRLSDVDGSRALLVVVDKQNLASPL